LINRPPSGSSPDINNKELTLNTLENSPTTEVKLFHLFNPADQTHNFLLFRGETIVETTAGAWCNYQIPDGDNPGVVQMMYATRESRIYAPLLLGVLGKHSMDTYGELPVGSHNLSCHSFPIQKRLATLLGQLPASSPVNSEDWLNSLSYLQSWFDEMDSDVDELSSKDLEEGKKFLIEIVNGGTNGRFQPAFFDRESIFAGQRRKNGRKLDKYEKLYRSRKRLQGIFSGSSLERAN
jgi:hypothetical protein